MMVQRPVARFWVLLSAWHVLPMSARVLSGVSCPLLLSKSPVVEGQVRWHRRFSCEAFWLCWLAMRWGCDAHRSPASKADEWTRSEARREERKLLLHIRFTRWQQTPHNDSPTIAFCFSFLTAHDKLFAFYSLPVTRLTFHQLLGYYQGDIVRSWCNLWYIQYELQTLVQSRWFLKNKKIIKIMHFCSLGGIMNPTKNERETHLLF